MAVRGPDASTSAIAERSAFGAKYFWSVSRVFGLMTLDDVNGLRAPKSVDFGFMVWTETRGEGLFGQEKCPPLG
jgi:hypothetical protein